VQKQPRAIAGYRFYESPCNGIFPASIAIQDRIFFIFNEHCLLIVGFSTACHNL
jgi:hypothetical protein